MKELTAAACIMKRTNECRSKRLSAQHVFSRGAFLHSIIIQTAVFVKIISSLINLPTFVFYEKFYDYIVRTKASSGCKAARWRGVRTRSGGRWSVELEYKLQQP